MPTSQYGAHQVRSKANEVADYHYDDARPGKPLYLLIPGGLIALATLALAIVVAYKTWFDGSLDSGVGMNLLLILAPFYIGGVFLFSYGYELYDIPRALRLTAIIVFITLAAVVIIAVLFVILGGLGSGSNSKSRSSKESSASGGSSSGGGSSGGGFGGSMLNMGPIFLNTPTHTVTREVVREVPVETKPQPIACPYCGRQYIPAENNFACPSCGAATPENLKPPQTNPTQ